MSTERPRCRLVDNTGGGGGNLSDFQVDLLLRHTCTGDIAHEWLRAPLQKAVKPARLPSARQGFYACFALPCAAAH